ncbi:MAG: biotin transporter BioY [Synergistaceae bacterium]|jgi:biotin transport system substrate-specific component|nr:biotin transporter BioY [Synergistaceae bacterium]
MTDGGLSTKDICFTGIFTAMMIVMAQISIPMPLGVPMTMQTFAVSLAGVMLGAKRGAMAAALYVLLGTAGLPVFANFSGGLGIVLGPTGGFIISFPVMAALIGLGAGKGAHCLIIGLAAGTAVNSAAGMAMFSAVTGRGLGVAFSACVLPFIPTAVIKAFAAGMLGSKIRERLTVSA